MKLNRFGFFRELGSSTRESMLPLLGRARCSTEVTEYLRHGQLFIASPGPVTDPIHGSCGMIGTASVLTDGVWAWREDTAHYVEAHGLELPAEFLAHMRNARFIVPTLTRSDLMRLKL